jgi:hypothetical protein
MLNRLVNSCGVRPYEHLKQAVCGHEGTDLTQAFRSIARFVKVAVIALLQLRILEFTMQDKAWKRWQEPRRGPGLRRTRQCDLRVATRRLP